MPTALTRALELADQLESYPLGKCSPSDDPDMQSAYLYGFLDLTRPFIAAVKRIGDPDLSALLVDLDADPEHITAAYKLKAELQGVIDHLREAVEDPAYGQSVKSNSAFLDPHVLATLRSLTCSRFDLAKLVRFCEELNDCYGRANYLACVLLMRAIMNHVPPLFDCSNFPQVVSQAGRSLKAVLEKLEDGARPIADLHTHALIRKKEPLPTKHQVEPYKASFELLIQEIVGRLQP